MRSRSFITQCWRRCPSLRLSYRYSKQIAEEYPDEVTLSSLGHSQAEEPCVIIFLVAVNGQGDWWVLVTTRCDGSNITVETYKFARGSSSYWSFQFRDAEFLVTLNSYRKWKAVFPFRSRTTIKMVEKVCEYKSRFGHNSSLVSHNGTVCSSEEFKNFCMDRGIKHLWTAPLTKSSWLTLSSISLKNYDWISLGSYSRVLVELQTVSDRVYSAEPVWI